VSPFYQFVSETLADGQIDETDALLVQEMLYDDGQLDLDDVKLLVEIYCGARNRSAAFEKMFFSVLEQVFLTDDQVQLSEQFYLLKMLYADGQITANERDFLRRLQGACKQRTPEFDALCEAALATSTVA
jgi:hypothetical protein